MFSQSATIEWEVIIPIFIGLFVIVGVRALLINKSIASVSDQYMKGNFEEVVAKAKKMKESYGGNPIRNKNVNSVYDYMCMVIATIALREKNDSEFLENINDMRSKSSRHAKYYWLCIYHTLRDELELAEENYKMMLECPTENESTHLVAQGLLASRRGLLDQAKQKLTEWTSISDGRKNPVAKEIVENELKRLG